MAFKTVLLNKDNDISLSGCMITSGRGQFGVLPVFKGGMSNYKIRSASGAYDGGDRVIGFTSGYDIDGDLLFTVGWGDGFAVRRLNNDGTLTKIYHESNFLYRDTGSVYNHLQSVAVDKTNKLGVVMTYNVDGYTTFDYGGCINGGTTFVKDSRPTHSNPDTFIGSQDTGNGFVRRAGNSYEGGLCAAGQWIYAGDHNANHYRKVMRRNLNTGVEERLDATSSGTDIKSGSASMDRSGYRYKIFYDEINDRIFYMPFYNGNFNLVLDASTSSPELVWCDVADAGQGDDGYEGGLFIPDPVNEPNIVCIGGSSRLLKLNITPCLTGSAPTVLKRVELFNNWENNIEYPVNFRFGTKYQKTSGTPMDKTPGYPEHCPTSADRGYATIRGFVDWDNEQTAAVLRHDNTVEDTSNGRGRSYRSDYGVPMVLMSSANGTKYWIQMGYGADGHSFTIWDEDDYPNQLVGNWELVHGTFTLDNDANVDMVHVAGVNNFKIPTNCTLTIYVSNDNGSTWETYDRQSDDAHVFTSNGTQLRVKIVAGGQPDLAPYYIGNKGFLRVSYGSMHEAAKNSNIRFKITRKRLR